MGAENILEVFHVLAMTSSAIGWCSIGVLSPPLAHLSQAGDSGANGVYFVGYYLHICKLTGQLAPLNAGHFVNCYSARPGLVLRTSKIFFCLVLAKISHPVTDNTGMVGSLRNNDSGERRWKLNLNFKRLSERRVIKVLTDLAHQISGYLSKRK